MGKLLLGALYGRMAIKMAVLFISVLLLASLTALPGNMGNASAAPSMPSAAWLPKVRIGALLWLNHRIGQDLRAAIDLAVLDANAFLEKAGKAWRLEVVYEDTATNPATALQKLRSLASSGIRYVIGPMSSNEVQGVIEYANTNSILLISPSSTGDWLAIPNDYVYRFAPSDANDGYTLARLMHDEGKTCVVAVLADTFFGHDIADATRERFEQEAWGTFWASVNYTTDYATAAAELAGRVKDARSNYATDKVAVECVGYSDQVRDLFIAANSHPVLEKVAWYGTDSEISSAISGNPTAAEFAFKSGFTNTLIVPTLSEKSDSLRTRLSDLLGREPSVYAYAGYDALWAYANSFLILGGPGYLQDTARVRNILSDVAGSLFGASGCMLLDENGDRKGGDHGFWVMTEQDNSYGWQRVGTYIWAMDSILWLKP